MKKLLPIFLLLALALLGPDSILCAQETTPIEHSSKNPSIAGFEFGMSIDSIYALCKKRFGEESIERKKGRYNKYDPRASSDSLLVITTMFRIYEDQSKMASYTLLNFQKNSIGELLLGQVILFITTSLPWEFEDLLDNIYDSYLDYLAPQYPNDYEEIINDFGLKAFRFGKEKYTPDTWYGFFNISKGSQGYMISLTYTAQQYTSFPRFW